MSNTKTVYYYPELRAYVGSINAVLIVSHLEDCFREKITSFYKFMEPCTHAAYKVGESWIEALHMTGTEFRTAFKHIGKVYKSKREYNQSKDKFQGKMYLSYYDRISKLTYYMRNDDLVNRVLNIAICDSRANASEKNALREEASRNDDLSNQELRSEDSRNNDLSNRELRNNDSRNDKSEDGIINNKTNVLSSLEINTKTNNKTNNKTQTKTYMHVHINSTDQSSEDMHVDVVRQKGKEPEVLQETKVIEQPQIMQSFQENSELKVAEGGKGFQMTKMLEESESRQEIKVVQELHELKEIKDMQKLQVPKEIKEVQEIKDSKRMQKELQEPIETTDMQEQKGTRLIQESKETIGLKSLSGAQQAKGLKSLSDAEQAIGLEKALEHIKGLFNQICKSHDQIIQWTGGQEQKIGQIWWLYDQKLEVFKTAFEKLEASDFLSGRIKSWKASLDWIFIPTHFADILGDKYKNFRKKSKLIGASKGEETEDRWDFDEIERLEQERINRILEEK